MNVRFLKYALALDEHRSFQHAARASNISPSALSRAIQALEDEYEIQLFDRSRREVVATPAGREFISAARMMILYADDLNTRMNALNKGTAGSVVFGLAPLPAGLLLSDFLLGMLRDAPQINVHVKTGTAPDLAIQLADGGIEFLICSDTAITDHHRYQIEELYKFDLYVMTRNDHPLTGFDPIPMNELQKYPMLGGAFPNNMWPANRDPVAMHTICNNYDAIFSAILASDACCFSPRLTRRYGGIDPTPFTFTRFGEEVFETSSSFILLHARERPLSLTAKFAIARFQADISKFHDGAC